MNILTVPILPQMSLSFILVLTADDADDEKVEAEVEVKKDSRP